MAKHKEQEFAFEWWGMGWEKKMVKRHKDPDFPLYENHLLSYLNINEGTRQEWKKEWQKQSDELLEKADAKTADSFNGENFLDNIGDPAKFTDEELMAHIVRALFGNLQHQGYSNRASEILARIKGFMAPEKQEVTHTIDGEQIANAIKRADRELREGGYRISEEPSERPLLPARTRIHTEQEHGSDS